LLGVPAVTGDSTAQQRLRICFAKGEPIKYISHLDLARTWERVFRRARLPVAYSQGFNPRPRFQIAAGLPVGVTGRAELLDLWLATPLAPAEVAERLGGVSPAGLEIRAVEEVELGAPALQSQVRAADYRVIIRSRESVGAIQTRVQALLELTSLVRQRRHKGGWQTYDLRPLIQTITVEARDEGEQILTMRLQASMQGAGRPDEVLAALGLELAAHRIERTNLVGEFDKPQRDGIISGCGSSGGICLDPTAC
jgi:radical SAM-linked protein